jgi:hypothetical protein
MLKMVRKLNKVWLLIFIFGVAFSFAQEDDERFGDKDYKDQDQFEKFYRRRKIIGAWQINQLKEGALVVKLKANALAINAVKKQGNVQLAERMRLEAAGVNTNIMRAFRNNYTFSKVYFIYGSSVDSLLNGKREGIFLDTNLNVDANIVLNEKFYLLAEIDRLYNSSIGFVKEDSARFVRENGSSNNAETFVVIKNKFGHQLKKPFPYVTAFKPNLERAPPITFITVDGVLIPFNVVIFKRPLKNLESFEYKGDKIKLTIPKHLILGRLLLTVEKLNDELTGYYQSHPIPRRIDASIKPFLY